MGGSMPSLRRAASDSISAIVLAAGIFLAAFAPAHADLKHEGCADLAATQFRKVTVAEGPLVEPVKMAFLPDGRLIFVERRGPVKIVKPGNAKPIIAWNPTVFWGPRGLKDTKIEDGTLGIAVDPKFETNKWIYILYSPMDKSVNRLSRFTLNGDAVDAATEKLVLEIPVQRDWCCHTGGGIGWDAHGNLFMTTGDNTRSDDAFAAINESAGKEWLDAQRSSGNTNDLRGKLLRIKPSDAGGYTIPAGNMKEVFAALWPNQADKDKVRPEIYSMGHRNPYTLTVDPYTGYAHIAEVGPDADAYTEDKGPAQHEEFNLVKKAGNYGWPYFMGDNQAYKDWDYVANRTGPAFVANNVVNASVNNTGVRNLPPAVKSILSREYGKSGKTIDGVAKFPNFTGTTALSGPVYYYDGRIANQNKLPPHFNRKWLMSDHGAAFLNAATLSEDGESIVAVDKVPLTLLLDRPVALDVGPDGNLYVIEYAAGNFQSTASTKLSRIEYIGTCQPATPVPPNLPTALDARGRLKDRMLARVDGGAVTLPASALGFTLYDIRGSEVWGYSRARAGSEERIALPDGLPQGVLKVRLYESPKP